MLPESPFLPYILAVNVHGGAAAHAGLAGSCGDRGPPAILNDVLPQLFERYAGFDRNEAGLRVP